MPVRVRGSARFGQVTGAMGKLKLECYWGFSEKDKGGCGKQCKIV